MLEEEDAEVMQDAVENLLQGADDLLESGPHQFEITGYGLVGTGTDGPQSRNEWSCWCSMHQPSLQKRPNLLIIEFELQDDPINPPYTEPAEPPTDEERTGLSGEPYRPTEEDLKESTTSLAKPIRTLRKKRAAQANKTFNLFQTLNQVTDQLGKAEDLTSFLKIAVGVVRELTGYDRVMIYQFDEAWNGQVVSC